MMAVILDAYEALRGVWRILLGRSDYRDRFDVSRGGVWRSFVAAILAIPFSAFVAGVHNALARADAGALDPVLEPAGFAYFATRWLAAWAYFPPLAMLVAAILGKRDRVGPWIVVQNWTHLLVVMVNVIPYALIIAGAGATAEPVYLAAILLSVYAYIAAARAALELPWLIAIAAGGSSFLAMALVNEAVERLF